MPLFFETQFTNTYGNRIKLVSFLPRALNKIILIIVIGLLTESCAINFSVHDNNIAQNNAKVFVIEQQSPEVNLIDHGEEGPSQADHLLFVAKITDHEGNNGTLVGQLTTIKTGHKVDDSAVDLKTGQLVFDFADYELVVMGNTHYGLNAQEMNHQHHQSRSVVGGSGTMKGARGQVTTVRNPDGSYTHTFELL